MEDLIQQIGLPLIAVLVPLVVGGFKKLLPNVPTVLLPILAALLGPVFELGISYVTMAEFTGVAGALMGLAGVGLREVKDQVVKSVQDVA